MAKASLKKVASVTVKRLKRICFSNTFIVIAGIISILFGLFYAGALIASSVYHDNPSSFCGNAFVQYRDEILKDGTPDNEAPEKPKYFIKFDDGDTLYTLSVSPLGFDSDYLGISFIVSPTDTDYHLTILFEPNFYADHGGSDPTKNPFAVTGYLTDKDDKPFSKNVDVYVLYALTQSLELNALYPAFDITGKKVDIPPTVDLAEASEVAFHSIADFVSEIDPLFEAIGLGRFQTFYEEYQNGARPGSYFGFILLAALMTSFICGPLAVLVFFAWSHRLEDDQRFRLICKGTLKFERLETAVPYREPGDPMPSYEFQGAALVEKKKPKEIDVFPRRITPFEQFITKRHIKPVLGEWIFRGVGLALVAIGTILVFIGGKLPPENPAKTFFTNAQPYMESTTSTGLLILVIALVGVISETHKGLKISSTTFLALGLAYYLVIGALFTLLDLLFVTFQYVGIRFSDLFGAATQGNIFFGIGIFAMIGFFLFEEPPEWFIKRKVFRGFAVIPTALALFSIVCTILIQSGAWIPNIWIRNLLFTRNFEHIVFGVAYEYIIFFSRRRMRRKYGGDDVDDHMARPVVQLIKNLSLVGLIIVYTIAFYCIPATARTTIGLGAHTYAIVIAPFFLFYKPAGKNHTIKDDVIYYALYIVAMYTPAIIEFSANIFGQNL